MDFLPDSTTPIAAIGVAFSLATIGCLLRMGTRTGPRNPNSLAWLSTAASAGFIGSMLWAIAAHFGKVSGLLTFAVPGLFGFFFDDLLPVVRGWVMSRASKLAKRDTPIPRPPNGAGTD